MICQVLTEDSSETVETWLGDRAEAGDLLLIGSRDRIARLIQFATNSPYSHAALVTGRHVVTEAYDYGMTSSEGGGDVYQTSFQDLLSRYRRLSRLAIYRMPPETVDVNLMTWTAKSLQDNTPTYPTLAALIFLTNHAARRSATLAGLKLDSPKRRTTARRVRWWADGPYRVHCSELATRLFSSAGGFLDFRQPLMATYMNMVADPGDYESDELIPLIGNQDKVRRRLWAPKTARGARKLLTGATSGVSGLTNTLANRLSSGTRWDLADLVMPGDLASADPLIQVAILEIDHTGRRYTHDSTPPSI